MNRGSATHAVEVRETEYQPRAEPPLAVRIYEPVGAGPFPILLSVHGGVWTSGTRTIDESTDRRLAARGIVVAAIDFRQPPAGGYPESIADVHLAVRWLKAHATELRGRADAVGAIGNSTGGHQVLLVALRPADPRYAALQLDGDAQRDGSLAYAVLCWPIVDPLARYRWAREQGNTRLTERHDLYWGTEEAMAEGNPQGIVDAGGPGARPPLLVIQGGRDENIPCAIVTRFAESYRRGGGDVDLRMYDEMPHNFIKAVPEDPATADAVAAIIEFVHRRAAT